MFRYTKIAMAGAVLAASGIAAYAATSMENDAVSLPVTKISLSQAVAAAEQQTKGRATRAELEHTKSGIVFDVEVVSGAKVFDVRVDADKGTVISSAEDKADQDDDHDKKD
ncbi:MAG: PepSY domain-containing protein [Polaromonas sp.]